MDFRLWSVLILLLLVLNSCQNELEKEKGTFSLISPSESGLDFSNDLREQELRSVFNYINEYCGGGVAIGDINNDGLQDVYLTGNMVSSRLFLNKGDMKFEDITIPSKTSTSDWCTAVSMADVNNDGWLDIYVARSYHDKLDQRRNLLFINNKDNTFTEEAAKWGVDDPNYSIATSFFDYDLDGDLDLFVGNHPRYRALSLQFHYNHWLNPVDYFSDNLFRNDGGSFTKVTEEAGILNYGFTLGVNTSDIDLDGYPDIFVTVDHDEPDVVYKNNGDGTFRKATNETLSQTSLSSMGIDAGDINHDIFPDLMVAEMLYDDHYNEKVNMSMSNVKRFEYLVDTLGYNYYQMHNFLHLNNGNGSFSDVSQLSKVHKSNWSWSILFMDYDHDGWQDVYVTNGLYKDVYHRDRKSTLDSIMISLNGDMSKMNQLANDYSLKSSQTKVKNLMFKSNGLFDFEKLSNRIGFGDKTISTGAAYGDLDNDGDLDLVVNNIGENSFLYQNNQNDNRYLRVGIDPKSSLKSGLKVFVYSGDKVQSREMINARGFQSTSEPYVHFGIGDVGSLDRVELVWPNNKMEVIKNVNSGTLILANSNDASEEWKRKSENSIVKEVDSERIGLKYTHNENYYFDYDDQVLLPHRMSEYGPFMSVGDVDENGMDDLIVGGPIGQGTQLFLQSKEGTFVNRRIEAFEKDKSMEDAHSALFDADGDGHLDLLVASTGYEFDEGSKMYQPRLYFGNGKGDFIRSKEAFEGFSQSASCVKIEDFDGDGDMDVFIGGRDRPKKYPKPGLSTIWSNDGKGQFTNITPDIASELQEIGMVRDAEWIDVSGDGKLDLVLVGEWMPITIFEQVEGKLENQTSKYIPDSPKGWWNTLSVKDMDNDGMLDFVVGNLGYNYKYHASKDKPFVVYSKDFDESGSEDIVLGTYYGDVMYPVRGKNCSSEQIPDLEKKFPTYEEYAHADIIDVYGDDLKTADKFEVNEFGSVILYQEKDRKFKAQLLPRTVQKSPVNSILFEDFNGDSLPDMVLSGNLYQSEIETGRADAGIGVVLINKGNREFEALTPHASGLFVQGDVKSSTKVKSKDKMLMVFGKNRGNLQVVGY